MAIYHLSAQIIGRSDGRSSVASASYRCGLELTDARTGNTYDFTRKRGIDSFEILAPAEAPAFCGSVADLWNAVEAKETRKNSQLAREFNVAIPCELNDEAKRELVRQFVKSQFVSAGVVATVAFHDLNSHNPHAHIMTTTRTVNANGWGEKARELNSVDKLREWREQWQDLANDALKKAGSQSRIDCRTLEAQGIDRTPKNEPSAVWHIKERGETPTEYLPPYRSRSQAVRELFRLLHDLRALARSAFNMRQLYDPTPRPLQFITGQRKQDFGRNPDGTPTQQFVPTVPTRNSAENHERRLGIPDGLLPRTRRRPKPKPRSRVFRF